MCLLILAAVMAMVSCSGRQDVPVHVTAISTADSISQSFEPPGNDFMLGPQDALEIRFLDEPNLNMDTRVKPDGTISVPYLEDAIQVFGMTPKDLEKTIEGGISKYLKNPKVFVNVTEVGSSSVFVLGEVRNPQIVDDQPLTLASALSRCGGLTDDSDAGQILVIRKWNRVEPLVYEVDFDRFLGGKSVLPDLPLQRYDIVIVPRDRISKVSEFIKAFFETPYSIPRFGIETAVFFDVLNGSYNGYIR